jgi:hypothetical protein
LATPVKEINGHHFGPPEASNAEKLSDDATSKTQVGNNDFHIPPANSSIFDQKYAPFN